MARRALGAPASVGLRLPGLVTRNWFEALKAAESEAASSATLAVPAVYRGLQVEATRLQLPTTVTTSTILLLLA